MVTVSGQQLECAGIADVRVAVPGFRRVIVSALVVTAKPLGFSMIAGMDAVRELGGVTVRSPDNVRFGCETAGDTCAATEAASAAAAAAGEPCVRSLRVEREDFCVVFDPTLRRWTLGQ